MSINNFRSELSWYHSSYHDMQLKYENNKIITKTSRGANEFSNLSQAISQTPLTRKAWFCFLKAELERSDLRESTKSEIESEIKLLSNIDSFNYKGESESAYQRISESISYSVGIAEGDRFLEVFTSRIERKLSDDGKANFNKFSITTLASIDDLCFKAVNKGSCSNSEEVVNVINALESAFIYIFNTSTHAQLDELCKELSGALELSRSTKPSDSDVEDLEPYNNFIQKLAEKHPESALRALNSEKSLLSLLPKELFTVIDSYAPRINS